MSASSTACHLAVRGLRWLVCLGMVLTLVPATQTSARADDVVDACRLEADGGLTCPELLGEGAGSDTLLRTAAYDAMTGLQREAMRRFEQRAVEAVLELHRLPAGDATYVRTWARDAATGMLQKLVVKAVSTPVAERTPDQEQVASWVADRIRNREKRARLQEGAEFVQWAGLDVATYWTLVRNGASKRELTDFLSKPPVDINGSSLSTSTGGYCKYRPPAPYTDYDPSTFQVCHTPCTGWFSCVPWPTIDQFVAWGAARSGAYSEAQDPVLQAVSGRMEAAASGLGFTARQAILQGVAAVKVPYLSVLRAFASDAEVVRALLPYADQTTPAERSAWLWDGPVEKVGTRLKEVWTHLAVTEPLIHLKNQLSLVATLKQANLMGSTETIAAEVNSAIRAVMAAGDVGDGANIAMVAGRLIRRLQASVMSGFDLVLSAVTSLIDGAFFLAATEALPGQVASHVVAARDRALDLQGWMLVQDVVGTDRGLNALRLEFAAAVDPWSRTAPVRPATATDPQFLVTDLETDRRTQTAVLSLGRVYDDRWTSVHARISGGWVVEKWYDRVSGMDDQSLELSYTSPDMERLLAWPLRQEDGSYSFFVVAPERPGFDRDTCREDGTCWDSREIRYLDNDGMPKAARLEPYLPATGSPTYSPSAPKAGAVVSFSGVGFLPGGSAPGRTYRWRFQRGDCGGPCVVYRDGKAAPAFSTAVYGGWVSRTWSAAGTYAVEVTVTDSEGRTAATTFDVQVQ